jgi:uridine phosphorylase
MIFENPNGVPMANGRNFHMQVAHGEVANRVLVVGAQKRAEKIATLLDEGSETVRITSNRGFTTITGRYNGVQVSIVSIGMVGAIVTVVVSCIGYSCPA